MKVDIAIIVGIVFTLGEQINPVSASTIAKLRVDTSYGGDSGQNDFHSIHDAQEKAREILSKSEQGDQVEIRLMPGRHFLERTLHLDYSDSGVSIMADRPEDDTYVSGGVVIPNWAPCSSDSELLCATVSGILDDPQSRHLYVNDRRAKRGAASDTVLNAFTAPVGYDDNKFIVESTDVGIWENPDTVELVFTAPPTCQWTESRCTLLNVTSVGDEGQYDVYVKQPCFSMIQYKPCGQGTVSPTSIENTGISDLSLGEWYYSVSTGTIYLYPQDDDEATAVLQGTSPVIMPNLEVLVSAYDTHDVTFDGIIYEHATWLRPSQALGYVEQQSGALVSSPAYDGNCDAALWKSMPGNLIFNASTGITITNCGFQHLGAHGLYFTGGSQNNVVSHNVFSDISGAAIQIGDYDTMYQTDIEKQDRNHLVFNNLIVQAAVEYHGNVAVSVGYTVETNITHNEISELSYGGISIGWGWSRYNNTVASDNNIEYNYIHQFKMLLGDGGGIYALGPQPNSYIRYNHVSEMGSGKGGGGYYPDEGSAYWEVANNVFSNASFCSDDCQWLHIWTSTIHDITVHDCFTDTSTEDNSGTDCPEYNITVVANNQWPANACDIASNAGLLIQNSRLKGTISKMKADCEL